MVSEDDPKELPEQIYNFMLKKNKLKEAPINHKKANIF